MTHPDGKEASHPRAPRARRGRATRAAAESSARDAANGYESEDESFAAAAEDAALDEETTALPEPGHATGAGRALVLSDDVDDGDVDDGDDDDDEQVDETAKPFLYDDEEEDDDDDEEEEEGDDGGGAADELVGVDQELADQQALLRRAGEILASLGRAPIVSADDDEAEEDGEFQWAEEDDPGEQVTLVDEEWLQRVASHAVRRVAARAGDDAPAVEASADQDALRPLPAKLELTLLEPALTTRLQSPGAPAMRQEPAAAEESAADFVEDDDESELVPLLTESAYAAAAAEAEAAEPAVPLEVVAEASEVEAIVQEEIAEPEGDYHGLMLDEPDAAPLPGAFEDFAARGGRVEASVTVPASAADSTVTPSIVAEPITVAASEALVNPLEVLAGETNTILVPEVAPREVVAPDVLHDGDGRNPELAIAADPISHEEAPAIPAQQPTTAAAAEPPLGHEFAVAPDFDIAEALAPEPEPGDEAAADEGMPPEEFDDAGGDARDWDGDETLGYESAREPAVAGGPLRGGGWTIPLLCLGIGLIACCLLIPLADSNRRLAYERQRLARDLESIQTQVAVNDEFLRRVHDDASLAERLAQRQMKTIRQGTRVLELDRTHRGSTPAADMSPFQLVAVQPPAPLPPYRPLSGTIANLCYRPRTRLYLMGVGLFMMACGLVLGYTPKRS